MFRHCWNAMILWRIHQLLQIKKMGEDQLQYGRESIIVCLKDVLQLVSLQPYLWNSYLVQLLCLCTCTSRKNFQLYKDFVYETQTISYSKISEICALHHKFYPTWDLAQPSLVIQPRPHHHIQAYSIGAINPRSITQAIYMIPLFCLIMERITI